MKATAIRAGPLDPPSGRLDAEEMLKQACEATGFARFGSDATEIERFRHDFAVLCNSLNEEAALSETGYRRARSRLHVMLVSRLSSIAQRERDRNSRHRLIAAPLIGTGLPRTGTTFLHGLLACDPAHRAIRAWEALLSPDLIGDIVEPPDRLYQEILRAQGFLDDALRAIHPFDANLQEECVFLQETNCSSLYAEFFDIPRFSAAVADKYADDLRWQIAQMQLLQRSAPEKRWVLKAPTHLFSWQETIFAFPDARIYVNHRDPAKVIASVTSLTIAIRSLFSGSSASAGAIAAERLRAWSSAIRDVGEWRDSHSDFVVVDVHFRELVEHPLETAARLYDSFDMPLSSRTRDAMARYVEANQHSATPARRLSLAECGLDRDAVDAAFADYLQRYGVVREVS